MKSTKIYVVCRKARGYFKEPIAAFVDYKEANSFMAECAANELFQKLYKDAKYYISEISVTGVVKEN